jgi:hypothetical protein
LICDFPKPFFSTERSPRVDSEVSRSIASLVALIDAFRSPATRIEPAPAPISGWNIVILDRGFVYVGFATIEGDWVLVREAQNIRRWGTQQGLVQLAKEGPQSNTVLDPAGVVRAPLSSLVGLVQTEGSLWKAK